MTAMEIQKDLAGQRLDAALASLLPDASLRARRRCIDLGLVCVNGRPGRAGQRLRVGDRIDVAQESATPQPAARLVCREGDYAILAKPAGLHSVSLAGSAASSLEAQLPELLPGQTARLLQRLDRHTSGLVCAALTGEAASAFRNWEQRGQCHKRYVAILEGEMPQAVTATRAIDTDQRLKSRVTQDEAPAVRHTCFEPLACAPLCELLPGLLPGLVPGGADGRQAATLAGCVIHRGCRHQIRAHAAHAGHPLVGDTLYGAAPLSRPEHTEQDPGPAFFLHAAAIVAPALRCTLPPPWPLGPWGQAVEKWLESAPQYGMKS